MVLVDSSVWIEAARARGDLACKVGLEGLLEEYEALLCSPVRVEVLGGAGRAERARMESFFAILPYAELTEADWMESVGNHWKLRDAGLTVPIVDVLVATLAKRLGSRVYAQDQHFDLMRDALGLLLYEPGYGGKFNPGGG